MAATALAQGGFVRSVCVQEGLLCEVEEDKQIISISISIEPFKLITILHLDHKIIFVWCISNKSTSNFFLDLLSLRTKLAYLCCPFK